MDRRFSFLCIAWKDRRSLIVYYEAGGACWDARTCDDESMAYDKSVDYAEFKTYHGIFDFSNPENPVADYNWVFIPYCTADVQTGSRDQTYTDAVGLQITMQHQGYVNVQSALQWLVQNISDPERIVLTGSSAGALGSIFYAEPIMSHYANVPIVQIGDGYVGIMPEDWNGLEVWGTRANEPLALRQAMALSTPADYVQRLYSSSAEPAAAAHFRAIHHGRRCVSNRLLRAGRRQLA